MKKTEKTAEKERCSEEECAKKPERVHKQEILPGKEGQNRQYKPLDARLESAVPFVRRGSFLVDVGTDHAYLPIRLCACGLIRGAIAADIGVGPIARAQQHVQSVGMTDLIRTVQTDGLCGLESCEMDDITIFGMGGELICDILTAAPFVRNRQIRLILQPMTHAEKLRAFLAKEGFAVIGESLSRADGRIYQTLCAEWDGKDRTGEDSALDLLFGRLNREQNTPLYGALLEVGKRTMEKRLHGKQAGERDADITYETEILAAIAAWKEKQA